MARLQNSTKHLPVGTALPPHTLEHLLGARRAASSMVSLLVHVAPGHYQEPLCTEEPMLPHTLQIFVNPQNSRKEGACACAARTCPWSPDCRARTWHLGPLAWNTPDPVLRARRVLPNLTLPQHATSSPGFSASRFHTQTGGWTKHLPQREQGHVGDPSWPTCRRVLCPGRPWPRLHRVDGSRQNQEFALVGSFRTSPDPGPTSFNPPRGGSRDLCRRQLRTAGLRTSQQCSWHRVGQHGAVQLAGGRPPWNGWHDGP